MTDTTGFQAGGGWYFKRVEDGQVKVRINNPAMCGMMTFDKDTWASIVASVSAEGENGDTFRQAEHFHAGNPPVPEEASNA